MTNAIEKTKRALYDCLDRIRRAAKHRVLTAEFEERLEEHLEELRKDAALSQARIGELYSSRQQWQDIAADRLTNLSSMTDERDQIQQRLHAIDNAYHEQQKAVKPLRAQFVVQVRTIRGQQQTIENLKSANAAAGEELIRAQGMARQYSEDCRSAEKHSDRFSEQLRDARQVIAHQEILIVSQRLAIADLYMKAAAAPRASK